MPEKELLQLRTDFRLGTATALAGRVGSRAVPRRGVHLSLSGEMPLVHGTAGLCAAAVAPAGSEEPSRLSNKSGKGKSCSNKAQLAPNSGPGGKLLHKLVASRLPASRLPALTAFSKGASKVGSKTLPFLLRVEVAANQLQPLLETALEIASPFLFFFPLFMFKVIDVRGIPKKV